MAPASRPARPSPSVQEGVNRRMLRVRDAIDRRYAEELDLTALAALAHVSPDHLIRTFRSVYGETPHRYLQRRRVERAMHLLRTTGTPVTEVCLLVGFTSLGTFSRTFSAVVGESPTAYRARGRLPAVPTCFGMAWSRPSDAAPPGPSVSEKQGTGPSH